MIRPFLCCSYVTVISVCSLICLIDGSRTLPYSKDKVWASTVKIVSQKLPIQVIEKDRGLISTQTAQLAMGFNNSGYQTYFYQPHIFLATWGGANVRLNVIVRLVMKKSKQSTARNYLGSITQ